MPSQRRTRPTHPPLPVDPDLAPEDPGEPSRAHRRGAPVHRSRHPAMLAAILLGGILGSLARYEVELAFPARRGGVPWATFAINSTGALFLGAVLTVLLQHPAPQRYARPFLCVGFTGAWTTMSSFALEASLLAHGGHLLVATFYVLATVIVGIASAVAGIALGRRLSERRAPRWSSPS